VILLDTSGLLAAIDASQRLHREAADALLRATPPLLLSPFVLAELDYLLGKYVGTTAREALVREVERGAYQLEPFDASDVTEARGVMGRYRDLDIGLADASVVVLAHRYGITSVLTLDERHFRAIAGPGAEPFLLLPADHPFGA
jgi:predicted nucleic acid-binding protein